MAASMVQPGGRALAVPRGGRPRRPRYSSGCSPDGPWRRDGPASRSSAGVLRRTPHGRRQRAADDVSSVITVIPMRTGHTPLKHSTAPAAKWSKTTDDDGEDRRRWSAGAATRLCRSASRGGRRGTN